MPLFDCSQTSCLKSSAKLRLFLLCSNTHKWVNLCRLPFEACLSLYCHVKLFSGLTDVIYEYFVSLQNNNWM